jgi:hypothetical protein
MRFFKSSVTLASLALAFALSPVIRAESAPAKKAVEKADDLPRHTYALPKPPSALLQDDAAFATFSAAVKKNLLADLAAYDIKDRTTLQRYKSGLLALALLDRDFATARNLITELRALEEKPALKLTSGLVAESFISASVKRIDPSAFAGVLRSDFSALITRLPWDVVQDSLKEMKSGYEIRSPALILGIAQEQLDPAAAKTGEISGDIANQLLSMRNQLVTYLPYKNEIVGALTDLVATHKTVKPDRWTPTLVNLAANSTATPVVIGIWDSGMDTVVYKHTLYTDKNGGHGLAFDLHSNPVPELLFPLTDLKAPLPEMIGRLKGFSDLKVALDTPEASALKKYMSGLKPDQIKATIEDLNIAGNWAHGSHVTGIAVAGNPFARAMIARITFDYRMVPEIPTVEQARKDAIATRATIAAFKAAGVRVVNMSWGGSLSGVEEGLEANGVSNAEERKKRAREIFDIGRDALFAALKDAPGILFVAAAGNSDNNVKFDEFIPSSFQLPNMITVGAVDKAGEETSFSSFGPMVNVHANGYEVPSRIPGGTELNFSGTSMAAPQVTNLAAKLFALDPNLTPEAAKALILAGCQKTGRVNLVNPTKTLALLRK